MLGPPIFTGEKIINALPFGGYLSICSIPALSGDPLFPIYLFIFQRLSLLRAILRDLMSLEFGEGNGNPLQCSYLENPRDGEAWQAVVSGVAQSRTLLKRLSSMSLGLYLSLQGVGLRFVIVPFPCYSEHYIYKAHTCYTNLVIK